MSETFDNPRDRRKAAQENMSEAVYRAGVIQQIAAVGLYVSSGKSGLTSEEKHASIAEMRQIVSALTGQAQLTLIALSQAGEHLDKALEFYGGQVADESSLKDVSTPEDLFKLTGPAETTE